jgi:hypothetical protein
LFDGWSEPSIGRSKGDLARAPLVVELVRQQEGLRISVGVAKRGDGSRSSFPVAYFLFGLAHFGAGPVEEVCFSSGAKANYPHISSRLGVSRREDGLSF